MAEQDLRNSSNVLAGTDAIGWPMVAHASGNGRVIADEINADWDANNMQYAGVAIWSGAAQMHVKLSLRDGGGADVTPPSWWAARDDTANDGQLYAALLNPAGATPPAVPGAGGYHIRLEFYEVSGPWAGIGNWEIGIFERVPDFRPPVDPGGGGGSTVGDCPERPPWPYLPPSMSARVGARGILRGARARR
jgi:hypothetical protein